VLVGHAIGLLAGFAALTLLNAWAAPVVLQTKELAAIRVAAAVIALMLTLGLAPLVRAGHPPAGATALLVALGSLQTFTDAVNVICGAAILALIGELLRRVRLSKPLGGERRAAHLAAHHGVEAPGARLPAGGR
jgi:hypothetical protein